MLIRNNTASLHLVPKVVGTVDTSKDSAGQPMKVHENVSIYPGINEVDPDFWAYLKENDATFQHYLENDIFQELESDGPMKLKESAALKLIEETPIDELLARWERSEKRAKVKAAIKAQREKLLLKTEGAK